MKLTKIFVWAFVAIGMIIISSISSAEEIGEGEQIVQIGVASFYHDSLQGEEMANGKPYNKNKVSVAHRTFPLGSKVKVTNLTNGKKITARVLDRGPYVEGRVVDLSKKAARKLGITKKQGVAPVQIVLIGKF